MDTYSMTTGAGTTRGMPAQLLTRREVAEWLQIAPKTLANWASDGLGPKVLKLHGCVRYERAVVESWMTSTGYAQDAA